MSNPLIPGKDVGPGPCMIVVSMHQYRESPLQYPRQESGDYVL